MTQHSVSCRILVILDALVGMLCVAIWWGVTASVTL